MSKKQRSKPCAFRRKLPVLILCIAVLILAAAVVCLRDISASFPRLEAAGFRVSEEAYRWAMYEARNDVLSDHAAAGISLKDWSRETELGDPRRLTMERAIEILSEYYAVGTLAVERGYLADARFEAMVEDMEYVNRERQKALESNAIVTGLPQFTLSDYIPYRASSLRLQFCSDENNPEYQVTQEEIHQRYEADKDGLYRLEDGLELAFLVIDTTPESAQELEPELQTLRALALELGDLSPALDAFPHLKACYEEITVDRTTYSIYARSHADVLACAEGLQTGEISGVFSQDGRLCLVQCRLRTEYNYAPLEDVESIVVQSIRESRYDALIAERMADIKVSADLEALYRYTSEQLP